MPTDERPHNGDETVVSSGDPLAGPRLRYWAAAKAAAGVAEEDVPGETVAAVVEAAKAAHAENPRFAIVLASCSLLLDERPLGTSDLAAVPVTAASVIDVLPPFAGGAPLPASGHVLPATGHVLSATGHVLPASGHVLSATGQVAALRLSRLGQ